MTTVVKVIDGFRDNVTNLRHLDNSSNMHNRAVNNWRLFGRVECSRVIALVNPTGQLSDQRQLSPNGGVITALENAHFLSVSLATIQLRGQCEMSDRRTDKMCRVVDVTLLLPASVAVVMRSIDQSVCLYCSCSNF